MCTTITKEKSNVKQGGKKPIGETWVKRSRKRSELTEEKK